MYDKLLDVQVEIRRVKTDVALLLETKIKPKNLVRAMKCCWSGDKP